MPRPSGLPANWATLKQNRCGRTAAAVPAPHLKRPSTKTPGYMVKVKVFLRKKTKTWKLKSFGTCFQNILQAIVERVFILFAIVIVVSSLVILAILFLLLFLCLALCGCIDVEIPGRQDGVSTVATAPLTPPPRFERRTTVSCPVLASEPAEAGVARVGSCPEPRGASCPHLNADSGPGQCYAMSAGSNP